MSPQEKAYIAGIIDGEGSIMLLHFHKNQFPAPCVSVASVSKELLQWLQNTIGYGVIKSKKNYAPHKHQNSYTYIVKYNYAINLLEQIEPYLVISQKKLRAKMIISQYKLLTIRNGRYSKEQMNLKQQFYEEFMAL
jgi:hypothetical protein